LKKKRGLLFRILKWGGLAILLAVLILVLVVLPYWVADRVTSAGTRPMDSALTSTPADDGLDFEDVTFSASDGVVLRGWYLGGGDRGVSIVCAHGLFRSRREVLDRGAWFRENGYNVLLMDSRRHGESGGERTTLGFEERLDVEGGIDFMREREPGDRIVLFGVSMGAAASLLAAAERPEVEAVIADSSFLDLEQVVTTYLDLLFHVPRFPLGDMLLFFMERLGGFRKEDFNLAEAVRRIGNRPILFFGGGEDRQMPPEIQRKLYALAESPLSELVIIEGAGHGAAYRTQPDAYRKALVDFLSKVDAARSRSAAPARPEAD
jgi:pimeloyl-ACP methyl ester carboxylesterase